MRQVRFLHSWKFHAKNDRRGSTPRVTLQSVRAVQFLWWWHSGSYDMRETSCESDSTKKSFSMEISSFSGFGFQQKKIKKLYNSYSTRLDDNLMKTIPGLFELLLNNL